MELRELRPDPTHGLYETRRSRLATVVIRQLAILVAVAAVVTAVGILRYAPLTGGAVRVSGATVASTGSERTITWSPGGSFEYSYTITNAGRWGVTVRGLELPRHATFASAEALLGDGTTPLTDFSLAPGESQRVTVKVTFARCSQQRPVGARDRWSDASVRFAILSIPRTTTVDLPVSLRLDTAAAPTC